MDRMLKAPVRRVDAHQLRQPLNVISLIVGNMRQLISQGSADETFALLENKVARIETQVQRMDAMIESLLESRDESPGDSSDQMQPDS
jgi:signal transduction histidine kinase